MAEGKATDLQFTPDGVNVAVKQEGALGVQPTISVSTTRDTSSREPVEIAEITGQFENVQIGDDSSVLYRRDTTPIDQSDTDTSVAVRQHPLTPSIRYPQLNQTSDTQNIISGNTVRDAQSCKNLPLQVNRDGEDNDLNVDYDVMVLYAEADRSEATTFLHHLQNDISLKNGESIKAVLYDAVEASGDAGLKLNHLEKAFTRCSYIFVYLTKNIVKDDDEFFTMALQSILVRNVRRNTKRIVPVFSKRKDKCDFDIPFGLNTLTGINYYANDDFYKKHVSSLIERRSQQRKLWAQRKKQANNPCQTKLTEGRGLDNVTAEPNQLNLEQMACSSLQDYHYEAFLAYSSKDEVAAIKLWDALKEKIRSRITCQKDPESSFLAGHSAFDNMANVTEHSDTTLVYLTRAALDSGYVCLEMMLALEKTHRTGKLCLSFVAQDLEEMEIEYLERSLPPACIPYTIIININTYQDNWEDQLISQLREPPELSDVLPVGNLAYGLVFSHYCGYLQYILPELEAEIQNHEVFKKNPSTTCLKYFLLIPFSCDTEAQLEATDIDYGVTIAHEGELKCTTKHADRPRYHSISIYKATKDEKSIFFIAEFPKALYNVFQIKEKLDITDVGPRLEAQRFYHTTNHLLNHRLNKKCNNTCVLLPYADEKFSVQKVLWKAVTEELKRAARAKPSEEQLVTTLSNMFIDEEKTEYDASVSCLSDDPSDWHEADSIANYLRSKKKSVLTKTCEHGQFYEMCPAKWNIFVISKQSFKCNFINIELVSAIFKCARNSRILMIPVVTGMSIDEVPISLKWVTMLSTKEKDFKEILLNQIDGNVVHMQEKIPAGDVSTGLGWSYLLNYLPLQLGDQTLSCLDFPGRIKKLLKDKKQKGGCLPYFYAILASDGASVDLEKDGAILKIGQSEHIVSERAGTKGRQYSFRMYKYTQTDDQSVCFVCEVCTPGYTLNEMTKLQFAGVEAGNDLNKQIKNLGSVIEGRLQEEHYKYKVGKDWSHYFRLIRYDRNKQETLCDVIGRHLKADLENSGQSELIYADEEGTNGNIVLGLCHTPIYT